ncbi:MAG TPA: DUF2065 domain-containing protein [Nitrospinota bacterium]|jgi:hypothetical protein|nr:DUF2065 domain-containing protein [Nitrospinota bacterium]|tara:strand:- start:70 stop:264 length:195 start_codon:yes stop_codon:yes gene_type:complete
MYFFFSVLGLVIIIEGLPYFCFPGHIKTIAEKIHEIDDSLLRFFGLALMLTGLLVIYISKKIFA